MNPAPDNSPAPDAGETGQSDRGWNRRQIYGLIAVALLVHVAVIYFFGSKKMLDSRTAKDTPQLRLTDPASELVALDNPALFASPNPRDFASVIWSRIPAIPPPTNYWTEAPRWLPLNTEHLGATFKQFMEADHFAAYQPDLKPEPQFLVPDVPSESAQPRQSELKVIGPLARRPLRTPVAVQSWPLNDVIPPTLVQVMVDPSGNVVSAVVLPSDNPDEAREHYTEADPVALDIARQLQFTPAFPPRSTPVSPLTPGEIVFIWHTTPVIDATNSPSTL